MRQSVRIPEDVEQTVAELQRTPAFRSRGQSAALCALLRLGARAFRADPAALVRARRAREIAQ